MGLFRKPIRLFVHQMIKDDVFTDRVRFHYSYRPGIRAGTICLLRVKWRFAFAEVRNSQNNRTDGIWIDDATRVRLRIKDGEEYFFGFSKVGLIGELIWFSQASNPTNRVAGRLALLSLMLGLLSLWLAVPPFLDWLNRPK